jgi:nucleotide-binding universal stress UspA family protein
MIEAAAMTPRSNLTTGTGVGSTALACVRHAPCPVVVLPTESRT